MDPRIARLTPEQIVAITIWGEARGQTTMLREAIGGVIQNRVRAQRPEWGVTPQGVCLAPAQFSCWTAAGGDQNYSEVIGAVINALDQKSMPGPILQECLRLAWQITGNQLADISGGAVYYYAPKAMRPVGRIPSWAEGKIPTVIIDGTAFFADPTLAAPLAPGEVSA